MDAKVEPWKETGYDLVRIILVALGYLDTEGTIAVGYIVCTFIEILAIGLIVIEKVMREWRRAWEYKNQLASQ